MEKVDLEALDAMRAAAECYGAKEISLAIAMNSTYLAYPAMAAEIRALREERDTLSAEAESIKTKWHNEGCAHCDERPGGHIGTMWCEECFQWWVRESEQEYISLMRAELDTFRAEAARLREALIYCRREFESHAGEDYSVMICDDAINSTSPTAEWLAARDKQQRRIGAAEELEKLAKTLREDLADMNPPEFASRGKVAPGYCECLQDIAGCMEEDAAKLRKGE